jgi:hypothetical protein
MKKGLIILAVAIGIQVGLFSYTLASIDGCLVAEKTKQSQKIEFCQTYLLQTIGIDDEFWG